MKFDKKILVIIAGIVMIIAVSGFAVKKYATAVARDKINTELASFSKYADFNYSDITVDLFGLTPHIWNFAIKPIGVPDEATTRIADLAIYDIDKRNAIPTHAHVALRGITMNAGMLRVIPSNVVLRFLLPNIHKEGANIEFQFQYSKDKQELIVNKFNMSAKDLLKAGISFHVGQLPMPSKDYLNWLSSLSDVWLKYAEFYYQDDGLIPKMLVWDAVRRRESLKQTMYLNYAEITSGYTLKEGERNKIDEFILNPKDIKIIFSPKIPVQIMRILTGQYSVSTTNPDIHVEISKSSSDLLTTALDVVTKHIDIGNIVNYGKGDPGKFQTALSLIDSYRRVISDAKCDEFEAKISDKLGYEVNIRKIDFKNFIYPSELNDNTSIQVKNGKCTTGLPSGVMFFEVTNITYANFDRLPVAVVTTISPDGPKTANTEIFIFTLNKGKVIKLADIYEGIIDKDFDTYYKSESFPQIVEANFDNYTNKLIITLYVKCVTGYSGDNIFTMEYKWNGQRMVLIGKPSITNSHRNSPGGEDEEMRQISAPYHAVINRADSSEDRKAIADLYIHRPYEYECDMETVDNEINGFQEFIKKFPNSSFIPEALTHIAWLELYSLQCNIPDRVSHLETAKSCYKEIFTKGSNTIWGRTAKEIYDVLSTDARRLEGLRYSKISDLGQQLAEQIPLCTNIVSTVSSAPSAEQKQNSSNTAIALPSQPLIASSAVAEKIVDAPTVKVGDSYTFETENFSNSKFNFVATREITAINGNILTVLTTNAKSGYKHVNYYDKNWNYLGTSNSDNEGISFSPALKYFDFPLSVGKKWTAQSIETDRKTKRQRQYTITGTVEGWEKVQVPTGEFDALKIVLKTDVKDGDKISSGTDVSWYVPALRKSVKSELTGQNVSTGQEEKKVIRLLSYHVQ